jgi:uncharacterized membrane protein
MRPLSLRQLTLTGLLAALAMALGATGLGFIPVPTPGQALTLMPIPVILAGLIAGPVSAALVGGIFGCFCLLRGFAPPDPLVQVLPRLLVGVVAWGIYVRFLAWRPTAWRAAAATATVLASLFHSTLVLGPWMGYFPTQAALLTWILHGPLEAGIAAIVTIPALTAARALKIHLIPVGRTSPERPC